MEIGQVKTPQEVPVRWSGLRIWRCQSCGTGHRCGTDSVRGLGTSTYHGCGPVLQNEATGDMSADETLLLV